MHRFPAASRLPHPLRPRIALALLSGMLAAPAIAQQAVAPEAASAAGTERRYAVEIILFTYSSDVASGREHFGTNPGGDEPRAAEATDRNGNNDSDNEAIPEYGDLVPMAEPALAEVPLEELHLPANLHLRVLSRNQLTMQKAYDRLVAIDAYQPVLWAGWTQATFEQNLTPPVYLRRLGDAPGNFDGTLTLYLGRFLHLVVDLSQRATAAQPADVPRYGDPQSGFRAGVQPAPDLRYNMHEDRIMKSGNLRYFDHPKFGLLAKVTRIEDDAGNNDPDAAATNDE